jgi:hypothetical protein
MRETENVASAGSNLKSPAQEEPGIQTLLAIARQNGSGLSAGRGVPNPFKSFVGFVVNTLRRSGSHGTAGAGGDGDFDADAVVARYLAQRQSEPGFGSPPEPPTPRGSARRSSFGRKR